MDGDERSELKKLKKDELVDQILDLKEKVCTLTAELEKYKNSNTPSSANKHLKPNTKNDKKKKKRNRGAPKGHKGTTRMQNPTRKTVIDADTCPKCGSTNLDDIKIHKKIIEEVPEPELPETVEYEVHEKKCLDCGNEFLPETSGIPKKGKFGINIMVLVVFLKFLLRGVLRKVVSFLITGYALRMAPASVNAILSRVSQVASTEYEGIKMRIRGAPVVYADETSFSVLGKNWWVWVFRSQNDILLVIRDSRGSDVPKEILGIEFAGVVVCDCWRAYNFLGRLQRCWAHLIRKAKDKKDTQTGKNLYKKLKSLFKKIKLFNNGNPTATQRMEQYRILTSELKVIVDYYKKYDHLKAVIGYIDNNLGNWFTCIKFEGIEPTNNFAEQAIRETVLVRKIIGAFRSESGKEDYATLASLIASWQLKGFDLKMKLKEMLTREMCF